MTQEQKDLIRLARRLNSAAQFADKKGITLNNGGEVGSILASIADELAVRAGYDVVSQQ